MTGQRAKKKTRNVMSQKPRKKDFQTGPRVQYQMATQKDCGKGNTHVSEDRWTQVEGEWVSC